MKKARGEEFVGISASCQPTNAVAIICGHDPCYFTPILFTKSREEEERLVGLRYRYETTNLFISNFLAVLKTTEALSGDIWRQDFFEHTFRKNSNVEGCIKQTSKLLMEVLNS